MITIFTPTYNRGYILPKLYASLRAQTCRDFEWLVVNDGSTDNTEALLAGWEKEAVIDMRHITVENGGKSNAINLGAKMAKGDIFFIVDSDDFITQDAVSEIKEAFAHLASKDGKFAGVCFRRAYYKTGEVIGAKNPPAIETATSLELAYKYGLDADKSEVFYTPVLKEHPFPVIAGCKFIPEALVWYRIAATGYSFLCSSKAIYLCEYLEDGLSRNFGTNLRKNHRGFFLFYRECLFYREIPLPQKVKYVIRCLQCLLYRLIGFKNGS